ncbi:MAG: MoxR family ATPase [Planctomycetes bacterium]|nr:MoxR family ATPase [Planctomycetota bacterium]
MNPRSVEEQAAEIRDSLQRVRGEMARVIVGMEEVIDQLLVALLAGGHVLLEGVPGLGKTLLARTLSRVLGLETQRIQFTPDLMPADILGGHVLVEDGRPRVEFVKGPVFTQVLLADEINRCTPKTQAALLEAMQEHAVTIGGKRMALHEPFFTLATQNPIEMEGTYPLPEAQLDRFFFKVLVARPDLPRLREIGRRTTGPAAEEARTVLGGEPVLAMQRFVREVPVPQVVEDYAARLILASSPDEPSAPEKVREFVRYGASPRGMQALMLGSRIAALLAGRFSASTQDVRQVALPALRHRLILNFEADAENVKPDDLLRGLLETVPAPGQAR